MGNKAKNILEQESIDPISVRKVSEDAGRMKSIFQVQTRNRGKVGLYLYEQPEGGERGRTIRQRLNTEKYTFEQIRERTGLRAPKTIATDKQHYIICKWLEGENTGFKLEEKDRKQQLAETLGKALSEIHSIEYQRFGELGQGGLEEPCDSWADFLEYLIEFVKTFDTPKTADKGIEYLENNSNMVEGDYQPVLMHGDYHAWNTVIDEGDNLGILDCEASFVGCREYEVTRAMCHWADEYSVSEAFINAYGKEDLREDWRKREDYYKVLHATIGLVDGIRLDSEDLTTMNKEVIEQQLE